MPPIRVRVRVRISVSVPLYWRRGGMPPIRVREEGRDASLGSVVQD